MPTRSGSPVTGHASRSRSVVVTSGLPINPNESAPVDLDTAGVHVAQDHVVFAGHAAEIAETAY
jgi:hypothetical protein